MVLELSHVFVLMVSDCDFVYSGCPVEELKHVDVYEVMMWVCSSAQ